MERYSYDVFGEPNRTSSVGNPYMFTGRRYDNETGFYYYRARYYSPEIGRFLQTDPIGYAAGLNLYTYCGNNPINWIDPWGLCKEGDDNISSLDTYLFFDGYGGPEFAPNAGHVEVGVGLPSGEVLVRTAAWGYLMKEVTFPNLNAAGAFGNKVIVRLRNKDYSRAIEGYIRSGRTRRHLYLYCSPYAADVAHAAGYNLGRGITPDSVLQRAVRMSKYNSNISVQNYKSSKTKTIYQMYREAGREQQFWVSPYMGY